MSRGPGRWQRLLLERLEAREGFVVLWECAESLGRSPKSSEYTALLRAAKTLAKAGKAQQCQVWGLNVNDRRVPFTYLYRNGLANPSDMVPGTQVSVEGAENPHGQHLAY